jgi:hypothetical protein
VFALISDFVEMFRADGWIKADTLVCPFESFKLNITFCPLKLHIERVKIELRRKGIAIPRTGLNLRIIE